MRLAILDRDGVINQDSDAYIKTPEEWIPIPGSLEAIARLCRAEYRVVIATNQSGIGRGLLSFDELTKIHNRMLEHIHQKGGEVDAVVCCPHPPERGCNCRKPRPGMLLELADRLKTSLTGVPVVGDSIRDLEAARAVNALPVLVRTGKGSQSLARLRDDPELAAAVPVFDDLASFVEALLHNELDDRIQAFFNSGDSRS